MLLKSRLYYVLFILAMTLIALSFILFIASSLSGGTTIMDTAVPLASMPEDGASQAEQAQDSSIPQDEVVPANIPDQHPPVLAKTGAGGLESYMGGLPTARDLLFYPPGTAPTAELEYTPVPFADLLPKNDNAQTQPLESK